MKTAEDAKDAEGPEKKEQALEGKQPKGRLKVARHFSGGIGR